MRHIIIPLPPSFVKSYFEKFFIFFVADAGLIFYPCYAIIYTEQIQRVALRRRKEGNMQRSSGKTHAARLLLLSILHLVTDALSAALVFGRLYPAYGNSAALIFLLYNLTAFVLQAPLGLLADVYKRPAVLISASGALLLLAVLASGAPISSVLLLGLGNALLHVTGGRCVAVESAGDIGSLGIFVSTGAVGLFLGQQFADRPWFSFLLLILFAAVALCLVLIPAARPTIENTPPQSIKKAPLLLLAVAAVVLIRAFVGKIATPDFALTARLALLLSLSTALGKALGGILCKRLGHVAVIVATMTLAMILQVLGDGIPTLYFLGVLAFNCSMPITLYYANRLMRGHEGFAFGALAALLIPGYLLALYVPPAAKAPLTALLTFASLFLLLFSSRALKQPRKEP